MPKGDIRLFSKMVDKGERGVKNLKKWVMSFMDGPKIDFSSGATFIFFTYYILINIEASAMKNQLWVLVQIY